MFRPIWMLAFCIAASDEPEPVAMVLGVQGEMKLRRMDLLRDGDEVKVPSPGGLRLVFLSDGHREAVGPGVAVRITGSGATPTEAVRREPGRIPAGQLDGLRGLAASARSGVARIRDIGSPPAPIAPMDGAVVPTDRPAFAWEPVRGVREYQVQVFRGETDRGGNPVWSGRTTGARLDFPGDRAPLERDEAYTWTVSSPGREIVARGRFEVASEEGAREIEAIRKSSGGADSSDRLLAALLLETNRVYDDSHRLFQGLAKELPAEPWVLLGLARHVARSGRIEEALELEKRALSLASNTR